MPDANLQSKVSDALALLPASGEVDMDVYREQLIAADPVEWKATMTYIMKNRLTARRLDISGDEPKVYLSIRS